MQDERRIAVLIDGDNAQASLLSPALAEIGKHGRITIRRIYGDWTSTFMTQWKEILNENAITPIQQFAFSQGKNSTDSSMIIDAMDILHSGQVNGFAILSSDSDFTRLATRIRENGYFVMGIGRRNSTPAFVNACEIFVYTDLLGDNLGSITTAEEVETQEVIQEIPSATVVEDAPSEKTYPELTVKELRELLLGRELPASGKKADLVSRLKQADRTYLELTVKELRELLLGRELPVSGKKADLVSRLKQADQKPSTIEETPSKNTYPELTVKELQELLRNRELPVSGKKADLVSRLEKSDNEPLTNYGIDAAEKLIIQAIELCEETVDDWVLLSQVAVQLRKLDPAFDPRTYGFSKHAELIKSSNKFDYTMLERGKGDAAYIRIR